MVLFSMDVFIRVRIDLIIILVFILFVLNSIYWVLSALYVSFTFFK